MSPTKLSAIKHQLIEAGYSAVEREGKLQLHQLGDYIPSLGTIARGTPGWIEINDIGVCLVGPGLIQCVSEEVTLAAVIRAERRLLNKQTRTREAQILELLDIAKHRARSGQDIDDIAERADAHLAAWSAWDAAYEQR